MYKITVYINVILFYFFISRSHGCMSTGGGGGVVEPECIPPAGQAALFVGSNTQLSAAYNGAKNPVGNCATGTCAAGATNYYTNAATAIPHETNPMENVGTLKGTDCLQGQQMCFCISTGECFPSNTDANVVLWPFNDNVYLFSLDAAAQFVGDRGTVIDGLNSYDQNTLLPRPVTEQNIIVESISCGACPVVTC